MRRRRVSSAGYVNPFAHAQVTPSRIDQGVDYGGTGPIDALGPGRVVLVSTTDSGWGNGDGWVSYQLTGGAYAGDYVYVAEGITPTRSARARSSSPGSRSAPSTATRSRSASRSAKATSRSRTASTTKAPTPPPGAR